MPVQLGDYPGGVIAEHFTYAPALLSPCQIQVQAVIMKRAGDDEGSRLSNI